MRAFLSSFVTLIVVWAAIAPGPAVSDQQFQVRLKPRPEDVKKTQGQEWNALSWMFVGEVRALDIQNTDPNQPVRFKATRYTSLHPSVVRVIDDRSGAVEAVAPGDAQLLVDLTFVVADRIIAGSAVCTVRVAPPEKFEVTTKKGNIYVGEETEGSVNLTVLATTPDGGNRRDFKPHSSIVVESSDPAVVLLSSDGHAYAASALIQNGNKLHIKGVGKGNAEVIAGIGTATTSGGKLSVSNPKIVITKADSLHLLQGAEESVKFKITGDNGKTLSPDPADLDISVTPESAKHGEIKADGDGYQATVTPKSLATGKVTIKFKEASASATADYLVVPKLTDIRVDRDSETLLLGETADYPVKLIDANDEIVPADFAWDKIKDDVKLSRLVSVVQPDIPQSVSTDAGFVASDFAFTKGGPVLSFGCNRLPSVTNGDKGFETTTTLDTFAAVLTVTYKDHDLKPVTNKDNLRFTLHDPVGMSVHQEPDNWVASMFGRQTAKEFLIFSVKVSNNYSFAASKDDRTRKILVKPEAIEFFVKRDSQSFAKIEDVRREESEKARGRTAANMSTKPATLRGQQDSGSTKFSTNVRERFNWDLLGIKPDTLSPTDDGTPPTRAATVNVPEEDRGFMIVRPVSPSDFERTTDVRNSRSNERKALSALSMLISVGRFMNGLSPSQDFFNWNPFNGGAYKETADDFRTFIFDPVTAAVKSDEDARKNGYARMSSTFVTSDGGSQAADTFYIAISRRQMDQQTGLEHHIRSLDYTRVNIPYGFVTPGATSAATVSSGNESGSKSSGKSVTTNGGGSGGSGGTGSGGAGGGGGSGGNSH